MSTFRVSPMIHVHRSRIAQTVNYSPWELAELIADSHPETLQRLNSILRHPRSLHRTSAAWRPPTATLPAVAGHPELRIALSRHRTGPKARARIQGYAHPDRLPAYLITARITDPTGVPVSPALAEAWIRALSGNDSAGAVHEFEDVVSPTYIWMVDSDFSPVASPSSLFTDSSQAA